MLLVLAYVFASFGLAFALGYGKITLPLRMKLDSLANTQGGDGPHYPLWIRFPAKWLLALLECPACVAFWLGMASAFLPISYYFPDLGWLLAPFLGFGNMGAVLSLGLWTGLIRIE